MNTSVLYYLKFDLNSRYKIKFIKMNIFMNFKFQSWKIIQLRKAIDCFYEQIKRKSKVNIDLHEKQISMIKLANKIMF